MRWVVEVSSLGKAEKEALELDAESWQKALTEARAKRGDSAPMSGFSIELLDEGCRAVDPMARLRYEVRKAEGTAAPASPPSAPPRRSAPPRPAPAQSPPAQSTLHTEGATLALEGQAVAQRPAAAPPAQRAAAGEPFPAAPTAMHAEVASPSSRSPIIFRREEDATDSVPLTYREYVYLVAPGTSEAAAEELLSEEFVSVRSSLDHLAPGKLVNLGVFDHPFQGRPPVPPLAALAWKDWGGPPTIAFPRRSSSAASTAKASPSSGAGSVASAPRAVAAPAQQTPSPSREPPSAIPAAALASAEPPSPPTDVHLGRALTTPPPPLASAPSAPRLRVRGEDLIADLFESIHGLYFARDAVEAGEFCLALAMEKLPSQAGMVHFYDIARREFLVACTRGAGTANLLLGRHTENDVLLAAAMRNRRAVVVADAAVGGASTIERYVALGGARSLVIAPVLQSGRLLGAIEIINPLDGQPFGDSEGDALFYIAEQLATFVSSAGIVTDPERIGSRVRPGA